jgi:hypothetical protein
LRWRANAGTESQVESQVVTQVDTALKARQVGGLASLLPQLQPSCLLAAQLLARVNNCFENKGSLSSSFAYRVQFIAYATPTVAKSQTGFSAQARKTFCFPPLLSEDYRDRRNFWATESAAGHGEKRGVLNFS